jgi:hypothetical protein
VRLLGFYKKLQQQHNKQLLLQTTTTTKMQNFQKINNDLTLNWSPKSRSSQTLNNFTSDINVTGLFTATLGYPLVGLGNRRHLRIKKLDI